MLAGMRLVDDEYKLRQNIKIAMLYLEDDDAVNAEVFIKKAATLIANCKARSLSLSHGLQHMPAVLGVHPLKILLGKPFCSNPTQARATSMMKDWCEVMHPMWRAEP